MSTKSRSLSYDHIDAVLFALGFVGGTAASTVFDLPAKLGLVAAFAPSAIRRAIFGAPSLPPPRTGALWSLASIVGLFAIIGGVGLLWASSVSLGRMLDASGGRDHTSDFLWTLFPGVGLVALGAFLTWARYPQVDE